MRRGKSAIRLDLSDKMSGIIGEMTVRTNGPDGKARLAQGQWQS